MTRTKIANGYYRSGYGRSTKRKANIYLIDGFLYAKDGQTSATDMHPLEGELKGYVRINHDKTGNTDLFYQVSGHSTNDKHLPFKRSN